MCVRFWPAESLEMAHHEYHAQFFFTFSLFLFGSFREVSKMWKEDLRQVYARMLHNYNQKLPICLSVFQNEKKILAMQNVHFQFWQVLHECCLLHPKK